jgi:hypothetical protein
VCDVLCSTAPMKKVFLLVQGMGFSFFLAKLVPGRKTHSSSKAANSRQQNASWGRSKRRTSGRAHGSISSCYQAHHLLGGEHGGSTKETKTVRAIPIVKIHKNSLFRGRTIEEVQEKGEGGNYETNENPIEAPFGSTR